MADETPGSNRLALITGMGFTVAGLTHLIKPTAWEPITKPLFPEDTQRHIYTNGAIETALGLGLLSRRTRKAALGGFLAYGAYLGTNIARISR